MSQAKRGQRSHPRYEVSDLDGNLIVPIDIRIINLSVGGTALETNSYLQFGRAYTLKLGDSDHSLALTGTVAWCCLKKTVRSVAGEVLPVFRAGLKFEALSNDRTSEIWQLIRRHALVEVGDNLLGRFRIELPRQPELGSSYDFAVRKLSLSGMLIETDFVPEPGSSFDLLLRLESRTWSSRARVASIPRLGRRVLGELAEVGVEFRDLGPRQLARLQNFIDLRLKSPKSS